MSCVLLQTVSTVPMLTKAQSTNATLGQKVRAERWNTLPWFRTKVKKRLASGANGSLLAENL
jgi:hypothetical protein